ncbi:4Fe-4S binding protein [Propylenella binzhouense]|uniref:4Fe-4S dicluster domain-containing protein n=1 Tax=Propylenella binzhouense TaxID=2555902 RepID=A0A964T8Y4_9HYPH|nr:4Fe-4S binding protein [Propylenella binzhouense]MYZ50260.1 4Fe-4S dicluster domain-containing protein [Propylenella binzhouense]
MKLEGARTVLVCSCERTMPDFGESVRAGCPGAAVESAFGLCGAELDRVRALLRGTGDITISCTQQAPLFRELADGAGYRGRLDFANIRETGGWSDEGADAGPKAAALLAMAAEPLGDTPVTSVTSGGVVLVYGSDEVAVAAGRALSDRLDVTVLLSRPADVPPPRVWDVPVMRGTITGATGHVGGFTLRVDDLAAPLPSSRGRLVFGPARDGATSHCDLILDLSGGAPLFAAGELLDGYIKADPGRPAAVAEAIARAGELVGEFDKPRYVEYAADLCAHSRSRIAGCTRCLDLCPTGAIAPAGDHVAIDPLVCAGCGSCAAACPTGAASYTLPAVEVLLRRVRAGLAAYRAAGGRDAVILYHDSEHGEALVDALGRFGPGLPARVVPVAVNAVTQLGLESFVAPLAWGAAAVRALSREKPRHDPAGLLATLDMADRVASALGWGGAMAVIETDDPDRLRAALDAVPRQERERKAATFMPAGGKRTVLATAMRELHAVAPSPVDRVALPAGAPFGGLAIEVEGCTLCHSCVAACPTGALGDDPDRPALTFAEDRCVQCGLCAATCPEKVIALEPRIDFTAWNAPRRVVKAEEPFHCIACGKPFGTRSSIERVVAKLADRHWMFSGSAAKRIDVIRMCDTCRVEAVTNESFDPYAQPRPAPMTGGIHLRAGDPAEGSG